MEQQGILTPSGKQKWSQTTVDSILSNEKYKGDALLQKKFTTDFLTKKMKVNEYEVPQYYVERSHPAIIESLEWDMVQGEITRRRSLCRAYSGNSVFSSKLVCGDCGGFFGQKVWHSNDPSQVFVLLFFHAFDSPCADVPIVPIFLRGRIQAYSHTQNPLIY